ncbi:MAG: stage III sporulation protein AD [Peptococcaceae bacterium]|nr:stage III sporulation protein AD [Peptococcaceae bacterium]
MSAVKMVLLAITAGILAVFVRERNKEFGLLVSLAAGILIISLFIEPLASVVSGIQELADKGNVDLAFIDVVLKAAAIAFFTEFGAQLCRDAGEGALAKKLEAGGKILILAMALPIFSLVLEGILGLVP